MTGFVLVRHSRYAVAADPSYEDAVEACPVDGSQAHRVRAAGGQVFATLAAAHAAAGVAKGHFSTLRINGAEVFVSEAPI